jgi:hypothetical protein
MFCQILLSILKEVDLTRVTSLGITNDTLDGTFKDIVLRVHSASTATHFHTELVHNMPFEISQVNLGSSESLTES